MGTNIKDLMIKKEIELTELKNKILIVDSFNMMYQFLTTIRQRDGTPLKDSHGNITSVLVGLSSRIPNLIQKGIKLAFVFDGKAPELKKKERERRRGIKTVAAKKLLPIGNLAVACQRFIPVIIGLIRFSFLKKK